MPFSVNGKMKRNKIVFGYDEITKTMTYKTGLVVDEDDYLQHTLIR